MIWNCVIQAAKVNGFTIILSTIFDLRVFKDYSMSAISDDGFLFVYQ
jgi:hypothetical protein